MIHHIFPILILYFRLCTTVQSKGIFEICFRFAEPLEFCLGFRKQGLQTGPTLARWHFLYIDLLSLADANYLLEVRGS